MSFTAGNKSILAAIASRAPLYQQLQFDNFSRIIGVPVRNERDARAAVESWRDSLRILLGAYAFARAGGEQAGYYEVATEAAARALPATVIGLDSEELGSRVWSAFIAGCRQRGIGPNARLNEGVLRGLTAWAVSDPSQGLLPRIAAEIERAGTIEPALLQLLHIKGVGLKIASFILRDAVWLCEIESLLDPAEGLYLQPVDRWVRRIAEKLWPDLESPSPNKQTPELIVGRRIAEKCRGAGVSGVSWNQGAWYVGAREAADDSRLATTLRELASSEVLA